MAEGWNPFWDVEMRPNTGRDTRYTQPSYGAGVSKTRAPSAVEMRSNTGREARYTSPSYGAGVSRTSAAGGWRAPSAARTHSAGYVSPNRQYVNWAEGQFFMQGDLMNSNEKLAKPRGKWGRIEASLPVDPAPTTGGTSVASNKPANRISSTINKARQQAQQTMANITAASKDAISRGSAYYKNAGGAGGIYNKGRGSKYARTASKMAMRHPLAAGVGLTLGAGALVGGARGDMGGGIGGAIGGGMLGGGIGAMGGAISNARKTGNLGRALTSRTPMGTMGRLFSSAGKVEAARFGMMGVAAGALIGAFMGSNAPKNKIRGLYV